MRIAYLDVFAGISGDMLLGALLDAGLELEALVAELRKLPVSGWEIKAERVVKQGISATQATVSATGEEAAHPHGRPCAELLEWIAQSSLEPEIAAQARDLVLRVAQAEGRVHGVAPEQVHFHELGGIDTVIDLVGAIAGLKLLGVERVICSPLPMSHGFIETAHGTLPVPPPAVIELVAGVPTRPLDVEGETVTPTGAALAVGLAESFGPLPAMTLERIGYGAGRRDWPALPNVLRLLIGQREAGLMPGSERGEGLAEELTAEQVALIETNLDDMSPELMPAVIEALLAAGALDVWLTPIQMKKGRPALQISVLAAPERLEAVSRALLEHSTTLGVRVSTWERRCLPRESVEVETTYGRVSVKLGRLSGRVVTAAPEFEDCRRLAQERGLPVKVVYAAAQAAAQQLLT